MFPVVRIIKRSNVEQVAGIAADAEDFGIDLLDDIIHAMRKMKKYSVKC
jgi:hypothetical protein